MRNGTDPARSELKVTTRLKQLIKANQSLAHMESLDELFPQLLDQVKEVSGAEASSFMLYIPERNVLQFVSIKDEILGEKARKSLSTVELKMGVGIAGWVAEKRQPINIQDAQNDSRFSKEADKKTGFFTRNLLCVPLLYGDELLGVINVLNAKEKAFFDTEDQELLESFADLAGVALIRSRLLETRLKQQKLETQLEAASKIQSLFLPTLPELEAGSHVWGVSIQAAVVGGDLYDVIPLPEGNWLMYVADVSDKGLPAALIMAALSTQIRSEALLHSEVDELLEAANDAMYDLMSEEGFFATIVLCKYQPRTGRMELVLGGHFPPLRIIAGQLGGLPDLKGVSLGIAPGAKYDKKEITILPGESILFMTDGATEAENEQQELFGNHRITEQLLKEKGPPLGKCLLKAVETWRGSASANDDLTIMEIWRDPA